MTIVALEVPVVISTDHSALVSSIVDSVCFVFVLFTSVSVSQIHVIFHVICKALRVLCSLRLIFIVVKMWRTLNLE